MLARPDLLADLDLNQLQHAGEASANLQLVVLPLLQLKDGADLIQIRLLDGQSRPHRFDAACDLLFGDLVANRQLLGIHLRLLEHPGRRPAGPSPALPSSGLRLGFVEFGFDGRGRGALLELIVLHLDAEVGLGRLG